MAFEIVARESGAATVVTAPQSLSLNKSLGEMRCKAHLERSGHLAHERKEQRSRSLVLAVY